eukprot:3784090-Rhodomonas_salina.3
MPRRDHTIPPAAPAPAAPLADASVEWLLMRQGRRERLLLDECLCVRKRAATDRRASVLCACVCHSTSVFSTRRACPDAAATPSSTTTSTSSATLLSAARAFGPAAHQGQEGVAFPLSGSRWVLIGKEGLRRGMGWGCRYRSLTLPELEKQFERIIKVLFSSSSSSSFLVVFLVLILIILPRCRLRPHPLHFLLTLHSLCPTRPSAPPSVLDLAPHPVSAAADAAVPPAIIAVVILFLLYHHADVPRSPSPSLPHRPLLPSSLSLPLLSLSHFALLHLFALRTRMPSRHQRTRTLSQRSQVSLPVLCSCDASDMGLGESWSRT